LVFVIFNIIVLLTEESFFGLENKSLIKGELICGLVPCFILLIQVSPSFFIMYIYSGLNINKVDESVVGVKIIGQQWF